MGGRIAARSRSCDRAREPAATRASPEARCVRAARRRAAQRTVRRAPGGRRWSSTAVATFVERDARVGWLGARRAACRSRRRSGERGRARPRYAQERHLGRRRDADVQGNGAARDLVPVGRAVGPFGRALTDRSEWAVVAGDRWVVVLVDALGIGPRGRLGLGAGCRRDAAQQERERRDREPGLRPYEHAGGSKPQPRRCQGAVRAGRACIASRGPLGHGRTSALPSRIAERLEARRRSVHAERDAERALPPRRADHARPCASDGARAPAVTERRLTRIDEPRQVRRMIDPPVRAARRRAGCAGRPLGARSATPWKTGAPRRDPRCSRRREPDGPPRRRAPGAGLRRGRATGTRRARRRAGVRRRSSVRALRGARRAAPRARRARLPRR